MELLNRFYRQVEKIPVTDVKRGRASKKTKYNNNYKKRNFVDKVREKKHVKLFKYPVELHEWYEKNKINLRNAYGITTENQFIITAMKNFMYGIE